MPLNKKGNKGHRLDTSSKRKCKHKNPDQIVPPQENAERINSISSLISESQEPMETCQSNTVTVLSFDSEDYILQFDNKKAIRIVIAFQFTRILESLPKSKWNAVANLMKENLRLKTARSEKVRSMIEERAQCSEEVA